MVVGGGGGASGTFYFILELILFNTLLSHFFLNLKKIFFKLVLDNIFGL